MIKLYLRHGVKGDVIEAKALRHALKSAKPYSKDCYFCECEDFPCKYRTACRDIENALSFIDGYLAREGE